MRKGCLFFLLSLFFSGSLLAQGYALQVHFRAELPFLKKIKIQTNFQTVRDREKELQRLLYLFYDNAYLTASCDSTVSDSLKMDVWIRPGSQYKWALLGKGNVEEEVLSAVGYREKLYNNRPLNYKNVRRLEERILRYYENNGHPFATIQLDSVRILGTSIQAVLLLNKNSEEHIDSVLIKGTARVSSVYLNNYLGIKPGSLYDESQLQKVNIRLKELPFVTLVKPSSVQFTNKFNKLVLHIDKRRASQFDGILGILPDNVTGKILFTGDVRLKLQNALSRGELIELNWKKLQTQTQDLKVHLMYPFLFRTPFGIDYQIKLYKRDTTYIDVNQTVGLHYLLKGGNYIQLFYNNKTSDLLSTKGLESATVLPPYADVRNNMYGLGYKYEQLDYRLNPRKGFSVTADLSTGTKTIRKNSKLNPALYDGIVLKSTQYQGDIDAAVFLPFGKRSTLKISDQAAFLYGQSIFANELFRIGGLKSLRGFDEESIYATAYSIGSLEYHFLLEQNSYLYLFGDAAWYENNAVGQYVQDTPFGFGAGISFETKAGIFSINYALGRQFNNPIELKSGKIHFGIVNYF